MKTPLVSGLKLLEDRPGEGLAAGKGDRVVFNLRLFLNQGEEIPLNERQAGAVTEELLREVSGLLVLNRKIRLGRREAIAAVEKTLVGMRVGGFRKVKASPHLAYGDKGVEGLVPPGAVLVIEVWLRVIEH